MQRVYTNIIDDHLEHDRQMIFLAGPRQVGKTTISKTTSTLTDHFTYLNWDNQDDQELILKGPQALMAQCELLAPYKRKAILTLDEIHKYKKWRNFLKGFYDKYNDLIRFIITGSAKLDVFRSGGDSLMGRYFPYRVHPLSVAELLTTTPYSSEIQMPKKLPKTPFEALIDFGGFPEPFTKQSKAFYRRWNQLRTQQIFQEDIRDLTRIHEISQLKLLAKFLQHQASQLVNYANIAKLIRVSADTVSIWIETLTSLYYCFCIQPWSKNISRSLIKQPKLYLWNWAEIEDIGARHENMVASHLLKAIHFWQDRGMGEYGLYFLRDKEKHEVDFLVTKNQKPWFMVEVKSTDKQSLNENLYLFQKQTKAQHAFQVVIDMPYRDINCFEYSQPIIVPAITFLSQLV